MLRSLKIAIAISVAVFGSALTAADAQAGWGHRGHHHHGHHGLGHHHGHHHGWGHHHHGFYGGGLYGRSWGGWGYPSYGWGYPSYGWGGRYTSLSIGIGWPGSWGYTYDYPRRYPYIYPGSLSSYDYYYPSALSYPLSSSYSAPYYSSSYTPYYSSRSYVPYSSSSYASSACCAPVVASTCCDPCAGYPAISSPATSAPSYVPDTVPAAPWNQADPSADATPSVRRLPPNWIPSSNLTRAGDAMPTAEQGRGQFASESAHSSALLTATGRDSGQSVSRAKPVTPNIATNLVPLSKALLQAADAVFAAGDYQQAAAAYARLTVRYGNHDELAVRRFIALVASGDCDQAAVMFETASMVEQGLAASALPPGGLVVLYGAAAADRDMHIDYLAAYALKHPDDGLALAMVGTWLELDGQTERAQVFMQRAAALAPGKRLPTNSAHLVATDVPQ